MSIENNNGDFFVEIVRKIFVIGYPLGAHDFALVLGVVSKMLFFKIFKFKYCKQGFFHPVIFRSVLNSQRHELVLFKYNKKIFVQSDDIGENKTGTNVSSYTVSVFFQL